MQELSLLTSRLDGRYDILRLLGRGSYAEIYVASDSLAPDDSPHTKIVIKALNVFLQNDLDAELEKTLVENFQNEALALDKVRHPNIISRLGHGTARDLRGTVFHYLVLEYLSGGDLAQASRGGAVTFERAMDYIEQVSAGLAHAHSVGIIHRDVKPQNLLLTGDLKTVKIADFGVARFTHSDAPITRVGTNIYSPPEHNPLTPMDGPDETSKKLTPAADVYSLAKSAYVLITGVSPRGFANSPITTLPESVRRMPWADAVLRVLNRATQNAPGSRHQTVAEFWRELSQGVAASLNESITHVRRRIDTPRAHVSRGYRPNVPEKPQFNPASVPGARHMWPAQGIKLEPQKPTPPVAGPEKGNPLSILQGHRADFREKLKAYNEEYEREKKRSVIRRVLLVAVALSIFTGALYATYTMLNDIGLLSNFPLFDKTGVVTTDVNLRQDGSASSPRIGLVPRNSRVRIVNSTDYWYEIVVIGYGRPKESASDPSRGWVNKRYVDVD